MSHKLLAIGGVYLDINSRGVPFGETGIIPEKELVSEDYIVEPGGSALNFSRLCVSLGLQTVCIGKIGRDQPGELLTNLVQASGVQTAFITNDRVATNLGLNFVNPANRSIMIAVGSANQSLLPHEVVEQTKSLLPELGYLYLGGCFKLTSLLPAFAELADLAKAANIKIVLDHARLTQKTTDKEMQIVRELALKTDYYFPSRDEFLQLWGVDSIEAGLQLLRDQTEACIVVKDGAAGAISFANEYIRMPAFTVSPWHTVGAGDSFNAGFITAQEQGLDLTESMRFGCATAALKISQPHLPTLQEVQTLIANG